MYNPFGNLPLKIISLFFAFVLWFVVEIDREFSWEFDFPLVVSGLPKNYVIVDSIPQFIPVTLSGKGSDLIKLVFKPGRVTIKADGFKYGRKIHTLSREQVELPYPNIEILRVGPPNQLSFFVDEYTQKELPVVSRVFVVPSESFVQTGEPELTPSRVIIAGPSSLLKKIDSLYTLPETLKNVSGNYSTIVPISPPAQTVRLFPRSVRISVPVERIVEKEFSDVPVLIKPAKSGKSYMLQPRSVDVILAGAESELKNMETRNINAFVDLSATGNKSEEIKPTVVVPPPLRIVKITPERVKLIKR